MLTDVDTSLSEKVEHWQLSTFPPDYPANPISWSGHQSMPVASGDWKQTEILEMQSGMIQELFNAVQIENHSS